ncbi:protein of unknown function [Methylacidimicrobium sp. AP8]|nr:protein of unknown function [Methylacidimicrobium sp. AP8]
MVPASGASERPDGGNQPFGFRGLTSLGLALKDIPRASRKGGLRPGTNPNADASCPGERADGLVRRATMARNGGIVSTPMENRPAFSGIADRKSTCLH